MIPLQGWQAKLLNPRLEIDIEKNRIALQKQLANQQPSLTVKVEGNFHGNIAGRDQSFESSSNDTTINPPKPTKNISKEIIKWIFIVIGSAGSGIAGAILGALLQWLLSPNPMPPQKETIVLPSIQIVRDTVISLERDTIYKNSTLDSVK